MEIPEQLVRSSGLTRIQIESLISYSLVKNRQMTLKQAASQRISAKTGKPVKLGAYYRTVQQGKRNLGQSIATVVVGLWLGEIKSGELQRLFEIAGRGLGSLDGEGAERAAEVIQALIDRLVTS